MNIFHILARVLLWIAPAIGLLFSSKQLMQFAQLASYQAGGLVRAFIRLPIKAVWPGAVLSAVCILFLFIGSLILRLPGVLAFLFAILLAALIAAIAYMIGFFAYQEKRVKVRLVYTVRVKRLYAAVCGVIAGHPPHLPRGLGLWHQCPGAASGAPAAAHRAAGYLAA